MTTRESDGHTLTDAQIEDGCRHKIGDLVAIQSKFDWANDEWKGVVGQVIGLCWDRRMGDWNITIAHDGTVTDGFRVDDLGRAALQEQKP